MAINFADDISSMLNVDEFATSITYRRAVNQVETTISVIFDNETVPFEGGGFSVVHQEQPRVTCRTVDVPSIAYGDEMVISSVTYAVREWIHDGTGVTVVHLEKE
jgi:hypothetical protein